jgi:hypothetical protein
MDILAKVREALQRLFGEMAAAAALAINDGLRRGAK